ncbi:YhhN family protein [Beauveria bassiana ARSEF 2860]|uniref:YhhN family protein n=1 Tax=Beauveria bassiana (strain ARSEF 2860) TaxID=655819 RepID=J4KMM6_BEAB2|nr:YhhN family protein [Beauveria bassiana ARSEF 2860]EJP64219.1 YhhN family protein [Beauveria bassiana ARSEF 2860]
MDWTRFQGNNPTETAVLAVSVASAVLYLLHVRAVPSKTRMTYKTLSTLLLACFAALRTGRLTSPLVAALALGSLGDAFLAWPGEANFLCGLASFLVAHLFYVALFAGLGSGSGGGVGVRIIIGQDGDAWRKGVAGGMLLLAPGMAAVLMPRVAGALRAPILVYTATILTMVLAVLTVHSGTIVLGGVLFALSDSILATEEFVVARESGHRPWMQHAVWILYYSGQFLIAAGF